MTQPKALRLADEIIEYIDGPAFHVPHWLARQSTAELRRLHEVNQELLEALKEHSLLMDAIVPLDLLPDIRKRARAAIAKATGETT